MWVVFFRPVLTFIIPTKFTTYSRQIRRKDQYLGNLATVDILKIPGTDPSTFYIGLSIVTNGNPGTDLLILTLPRH